MKRNNNVTPAFPTDDLCSGIREVVGIPAGGLPLHVPAFGPSANRYVKECVDTGWVSSVGKFVDQFEVDLSKLTGAKRVIATVNGTSALHIALLVSGVTPDTEVLCPSLTFVATANAVQYCNATPHFVDVESTTLGVDAVKLREHLQANTMVRDGQCFNKSTGRQISGLIAMHTFGHPFEIPSILDVCGEFHLPLIEDAAESIGSFYHGKHTGTFGRTGIISFNGNKTVTTGGGGAVLLNDEDLAVFAKQLTTTGKVPHPYRFFHDKVAYNYRLPNINAALGISQLESLPEILHYKRTIAHGYLDRFADSTAFSILGEPEGCESNYWLNAVVLADQYAGQQDAIIQQMHDQGVFARPIWEPLHTLEIYQDCPRADLSQTERFAKTIINIPSSPRLKNPASGAHS